MKNRPFIIVDNSELLDDLPNIKVCQSCGRVVTDLDIREDNGFNGNVERFCNFCDKMFYPLYKHPKDGRLLRSLGFGGNYKGQSHFAYQSVN